MSIIARPVRFALLALICAVPLAACGSTVTGTGPGGHGDHSSGGFPSGSGAAPKAPALGVTWKQSIGGQAGSDQQLTSGMGDGTRFYVSRVDGKVFSLDASTGKVVWSAQPGARSGVGVGVADGLVFYHDTDLGLFALDAKTGAQRWHVKDNYVFDPVRYVPAVAKGVIAVQTTDGLRGLDVATGRVKWTDPKLQYLDDAPASDAKAIYTAAPSPGTGDEVIESLSPRTGATAWRAKLTIGADMDVYLSVRSGLILVHTEHMGSDPTGKLTALDSRTGKVKWSVDAAGVGAAGEPPPVAVSGEFVYPSAKGVVAYAATDGSVRYTTAMDTGGSAAGVVACGGLVCGIGLSKVAAVDASGHTAGTGTAPSDEAVDLAGSTDSVVYLVSSSTVYRFS